MNGVTLSPEQLAELKESIKAEVTKELTGKDPHTHIEKSPFNKVRDKWARCMGPLHKAFGNYRYARMWDCIRLMSTYAVGCDYVREFTESKAEKAGEIAEYLCKYIIEEREKN